MLVLVILLPGASCSRDHATKRPDDQRPTSVAQDGHQQMIRTLASVAEQAAQTNKYFNGEYLLETAQRELTESIATDDLVGQVEALKTVGLYELNLGNSAAAAEHFVACADLMPEVERRQLARISAASKANVYLKCAVAYLRVAEDQNCVHCTDGTACILPIAPEAVHQQRTGSENAMKYLTRVLEIEPRNAIAAWLLNVTAMTLGEYPAAVPEEYRVPPDRFSSPVDFPRFRNIAFDLGLDTLSHAGGAVGDDFDGDGWLDIVVSDWNPAGQIHYFRNRGDGTFEKATERANLAGITGGLNLIHADYDNDGDLDLYVLRGAWLQPDVGSYPNSLLQNDGTGRFTDVTYDVGLGDSNHPTQTAAFADYDNDGDLDLYVGNERTQCQLFRNDDGRFVDMADQAGVANRLGYAKAVTWGDFDNDRWPDLYVSNLGQNNLLFHNQKDGTFREVAADKHVTAPEVSFVTWFWDYNQDGKLDLFVGSYTVGVQYVGLDYLNIGNMTELDCLYQNIGGGEFREVGKAMGLTAVTQPMGCNYGDLDNDGYLDFYLGTGYPGYEGLMPNMMYRNLQGSGFEEVTFAGGFGHLQKGHGVSFADFDHDGDQDIFAELGGAYQGDAFHNALFENPGFNHHWIKVRLIGTRSNRCAIGARIKLTVKDGSQTRDLYRWVSSGSSFGGNPLRQEIGLGTGQHIEKLEVYWPTSDLTQQFVDLDVDQMVEITEGDAELRVIPVKAVRFDAH